MVDEACLKTPRLLGFLSASGSWAGPQQEGRGVFLHLVHLGTNEVGSAGAESSQLEPWARLSPTMNGLYSLSCESGRKQRVLLWFWGLPAPVPAGSSQMSTYPGRW